MNTFGKGLVTIFSKKESIYTSTKRFNSNTKKWKWGYAHSYAVDISDAVSNCCSGIREQMKENHPDVIFVTSTGHKSTKGLLQLIEQQGFDPKKVIGCTSGNGTFQGTIPEVLNERYSETPKTFFSMTVGSLPEVDLIPFYVPSERIPSNKEFNMSELQRKLPAEQSSLMILFVKKYCFREKRFFSVLDNLFPHTPKVGCMLGSYAMNNHLPSSPLVGLQADPPPDDFSIKATEHMRKDVLFACGERFVYGAAGIYLRGKFEYKTTVTHNLIPLFREKNVITDIAQKILSLDGVRVWDYFDKMIEQEKAWEDIFREKLYARIERADGPPYRLDDPSNILPVSYDTNRKSGLRISHFHQSVNKHDLIQFFYRGDKSTRPLLASDHLSTQSIDISQSSDRCGVFCFSSNVPPNYVNEAYLHFDEPKRALNETNMFVPSVGKKGIQLRPVHLTPDLELKQLSEDKERKETMLRHLVQQDALHEDVLFTPSQLTPLPSPLDQRATQPPTESNHPKCTGLFSYGSILSSPNNVGFTTKPSLFTSLVVSLEQKPDKIN